MTDAAPTMLWHGRPISSLDLRDFTEATRHAFRPVPHSLHAASNEIYDAFLMDRVLCQEACRVEGVARLAAIVEKRV